MNFEINVNNLDSENNDFLYIWNTFGSRPNRLNLNNMYDGVVFDNIEYLEHINEMVDYIENEDNYSTNSKVLQKINNGIYISYVLMDGNTDESTVVDVSFYYKNKSDLDTINAFIEVMKEFYIDIEDGLEHHNETKKSNKLVYVSMEQGTVILEEIEAEYNFNKSYYNKESLESFKNLVNELKTSEKGISILWGERGVGKTSLIKKLHKDVKKEVIFIPNTLIHVLNDMEFIRSVAQRSPIIVLDDCENTMSVSHYQSSITNTILQFTDTIINEKIKLNFVLLFNSKISEIESTLLDSNYIIDIININKLSDKEATKLSSKLNIDRKYSSPTRLIDVLEDYDSIEEVGF